MGTRRKDPKKDGQVDRGTRIMTSHGTERKGLTYTESWFGWSTATVQWTVFGRMNE